MPVAVGVLVAIIFLIVFSEWFYHTVVGWREVIIDDRLFKYRVFGATALSLIVIMTTFVGAAYMSKCPSTTESDGVFEKLNCEEYQKIRVKVGF
ncbi:hypothetical protein A2572_03900 [Candidatus Collierbacteria bacterium RIFOXYD1_FULL_40_9]|uniref:Uncharacterized protein n=1 Tax=Candidatus Collierbacteria bacterium RIFOXYD1_FULL_40_9 TaxID=1817731 RepID=A0A1F5FW13_9BACT|nr:MAG: hypothetical protein A2572_03900 [Candidatus Collierbacteria bacterium RIFOXYD1_FULL_40_9]